MCTLNSFYLQNFLQNFLHTPYYTVHGPGSHHHGLHSQIRHWENCWLEIISPELMFEFLISLTSISQCQSKGQLLFNVTGNNSFPSLPQILGSSWLHESLSIEIQCSKAFSINQIIITFTHNQCMWCLHNHCCKAKCT